MEQPEFILCAAIKHGEVIISGHRHGNCYSVFSKLTGSYDSADMPGREDQGFLTSKNRFVDRKEAYRIAKANNQIVWGADATENGDDSILISENLY